MSGLHVIIIKFDLLTSEAVEYPDGTEVTQMPATDAPLMKAPVKPTSQQNPFPKLPVHNDQAALAQLGAPSTLPRQLLADNKATISAIVFRPEDLSYTHRLDSMPPLLRSRLLGRMTLRGSKTRFRKIGYRKGMTLTATTNLGRPRPGVGEEIRQRKGPETRGLREQQGRALLSRPPGNSGHQQHGNWYFFLPNVKYTSKSLIHCLRGCFGWAIYILSSSSREEPSLLAPSKALYLGPKKRSAS